MNTLSEGVSTVPRNASDHIQRFPRFALAAAAATLAAAFGLSFLGRVWPYAAQPLLHFLLQVTVVKLAGDLAYYLVSPRYREMAHLDDYLANDFITFYRFALPLAVIQALFLVRGAIPPSFHWLWWGPLPAAALYLVNRWLLERDQDKRRQERGGIPSVGRSS